MPTTKKVKTKKPKVSQSFRNRKAGAFEELRNKKRKEMLRKMGKTMKPR